MNENNDEDLTHADWLFFSEEKLIQRIANDLSISYSKGNNGSKLMTISGISETDISNLMFITNTDINHNYMYIDSFNMFISGLSMPLIIPGFDTIVKNIFRNSDMTAFLNQAKIHNPFTLSNITRNSTFSGNNFNEFLDEYSGLVPYITDTIGRSRTYEIVLRIDTDKM